MLTDAFNWTLQSNAVKPEIWNSWCQWLHSPFSMDTILFRQCTVVISESSAVLNVQVSLLRYVFSTALK